MRTTFVILLLTLSSICSSQARAQAGPGCGPANIKFDVKTKKGKHAAPAIEQGKALVFFLQDDLKFNAMPRPTTRFGIDGTWVGATHANSYFYVFVDPGEHHLCANWQSLVSLDWLESTRSTAAAHFTAQGGKSYYFRARDIENTEDAGEPEVKLLPVDADEAQVLMSSFSFSISHPNK